MRELASNSPVCKLAYQYADLPRRAIAMTSPELKQTQIRSAESTTPFEICAISRLT